MEYVANIKAIGGRKGRVWTESGNVDLTIIPPGSNRQGVTPEELLAAAWGACYGGAFAFESRGSEVDPTPEFRVEVVLDANGSDFTITGATLEVLVNEHQDEAAVAKVAEQAHLRCPVSKVFVGGIGSTVVRVVRV